MHTPKIVLPAFGDQMYQKHPNAEAQILVLPTWGQLHKINRNSVIENVLTIFWGYKCIEIVEMQKSTIRSQACGDENATPLKNSMLLRDARSQNGS